MTTFGEFLHELVGNAHWLLDEGEIDLDHLDEPQIAVLIAHTVRALRTKRCVGCGQEPTSIGEWFMVNDDLWKKHGVGDLVLCIGCLEDRLGRELTRSDFKETALREAREGNSDRLNDRLKRE